MKVQNESREMGSRNSQLAKLQGDNTASFCRRISEWSRNYRVTKQHLNLRWNFLDPSTFPEICFGQSPKRLDGGLWFEQMRVCGLSTCTGRLLDGATGS